MPQRHQQCQHFFQATTTTPASISISEEGGEQSRDCKANIIPTISRATTTIGLAAIKIAARNFFDLLLDCWTRRCANNNSSSKHRSSSAHHLKLPRKQNKQFIVVVLLFHLLYFPSICCAESFSLNGHQQQQQQRHLHGCTIQPDNNNNNGTQQQEQPMCCTGRNMSCKARDVPSPLPIYRFAVRSGEVPEIWHHRQKIGNMMLPGFVALDAQGVELLDRMACLHEQFRLYEAKTTATTIASAATVVDDADNVVNVQTVRRERRQRKRHGKIAPADGNNSNGTTKLDGEEKEEEETLLVGGGAEEVEEERTYHFGFHWKEWSEFERLITERNWPIIRYSLLRRNLPLRVVKKHRPHHRYPALYFRKVPKMPRGRQQSRIGTAGTGNLSALLASTGEHWRVFFLAEATAECYCDEMCTRYGDCCSNYAHQCPPVHCLLSEWSQWSGCITPLDNNNNNANASSTSCGVGTRFRRRHVLREKANAGMECAKDAMEQQIGCFKECQLQVASERILPVECGAKEYAQPDVTTVALLLDYRYRRARQMLPRIFNRGRVGVGSNKLAGKTQQYYKRYCVHYRIKWLNRNCVQPEWRQKLAMGRHICAECQPEAQFHRPRSRCASDLEDGQTGFWKLIGPPSCYGIWHRLYANSSSSSSSSIVLPDDGPTTTAAAAIDNGGGECDCGQWFPGLSPFLLV